MNMTYHASDLPLSQVNNLLTGEENYRQSVVFLPSSYAKGIEAGDFILVRSKEKETNGEYADGLLLVTNVLESAEGIFWLSLAASVRPLTDDEQEACDECGGEGRIWEQIDAMGGEFLGCEKCGGYGKVAAL